MKRNEAIPNGVVLAALIVLIILVLVAISPVLFFLVAGLAVFCALVFIGAAAGGGGSREGGRGGGAINVDRFLTSDAAPSANDPELKITIRHVTHHKVTHRFEAEPAKPKVEPVWPRTRKSWDFRDAWAPESPDPFDDPVRRPADVSGLPRMPDPFGGVVRGLPDKRDDLFNF